MCVCAQNVKFAKRVLSVWDNGLATADDVQILQLSVAGDMVILLEEKKVQCTIFTPPRSCLEYR